jgi:hypothetical protein
VASILGASRARRDGLMYLHSTQRPVRVSQSSFPFSAERLHVGAWLALSRVMGRMKMRFRSRAHLPSLVSATSWKPSAGMSRAFHARSVVGISPEVANTPIRP